MLESILLISFSLFSSNECDYYLTEYNDLKAAFIKADPDAPVVTQSDVDFARFELDQCAMPQGVNYLTADFDVKWYLIKYPDVKNAYNSSSYRTSYHWSHYGINEGRIGSLAFDPAYYLSVNQDLKNAFGTNYRAALNHWLDHGLREGREASPFFNIKWYIEHNPDVKNEFGDNNLKILRHAMTYGLIEGRSLTFRHNLTDFCPEETRRKCAYENAVRMTR